MTRSVSLGLVTGLIALLLSIIFAVGVGAVSIPIPVVSGILINKFLPGTIEAVWAAGRESIIWEIRLPRILLAVLVGAGLAVVGASLQSVTRNPLADPHLMGISSGAAFGAILALLHTGMFLGLLTVPVLAFAGALVATLIVVSVAKIQNATSSDRLVLAGVAISFIVMSCANGLIFLGDPRATSTVVFWMLGGLGRAQWDNLIYPLIILMPTSLWLWSRSADLNAMTVGDETATTLGITVDRFRLQVLVVGALITGVMVAFSGIIGFVGLIMPHIVRFIFGGNNARVIPFSALFGAIFMIWADIGARMLVAPEDLPIGVVTGIIGGSFFVWLLGRR